MGIGEPRKDILTIIIIMNIFLPLFKLLYTSKAVGVWRFISFSYPSTKPRNFWTRNILGRDFGLTKFSPYLEKKKTIRKRNCVFHHLHVTFSDVSLHFRGIPFIVLTKHSYVCTMNMVVNLSIIYIVSLWD